MLRKLSYCLKAVVILSHGDSVLKGLGSNSGTLCQLALLKQERFNS